MFIRRDMTGTFVVNFSDEERQEVRDYSMSEHIPESIVVQKIVELGYKKHFPKVDKRT